MVKHQKVSEYYGQDCTLLILFLIILVILLGYENGKFFVQHTISQECAYCRQNRLWENLFYKKLPVNNFFGDSVKAVKVSYILLDKTREAEIQF